VWSPIYVWKRCRLRSSNISVKDINKMVSKKYHFKTGKKVVIIDGTAVNSTPSISNLKRKEKCCLYTKLLNADNRSPIYVSVYINTSYLAIDSFSQKPAPMLSFFEDDILPFIILLYSVIENTMQ
jgi:hypothetical protein